MIELGDKVRDTISGLEGVATGRSTYLNGCISICISATTTTKDGAIPDTVWLDEQRLIVVEAGAFRPQPSSATAGGPQPQPPKDGAR